MTYPAAPRPAIACPAHAASALAVRLTAAPLVGDPAASEPRLDDLLKHDDVAALVDAYPLARRVLAGIAGGSPFLYDLAATDPARLVRLFTSAPEERLAALIEETRAAVVASPDDAGAMRALRLMKQEAALLIALADIGGVWDLARVTGALTEIADVAVQAALRRLLLAAASEGKLVPPDPAEPERGSGYFVLAMGKMGAGELNYSSDIDLVVFYDRERAPLRPGVEVGPLFVRITRGLVKLLQERTADGYVFRVDLRLRPDPASTQVAMTTIAGLHYYEREGQTWERSAYIKARPCAGDYATAAAFLDELVPFIWRRFLDYAAISDVHAMKRQIHAYRGHDDIAVEGHNVKLGRGGIREIEFFAQTQQLIVGGRNAHLRLRQTLAALAALAEGGWIAPAARDELTAAYEFLRAVEHRLQMVADEQTQSLPEETHALDAFARFFGHDGRDAFADAILPHLRTVQRHYAGLFEDAPPVAQVEGAFRFPDDRDDKETLDTLKGLGFRDPLAASFIVREWLAGRPRALRSEASRALLADLVPALLDGFASSGNADVALTTFDRFVSGLGGALRLLTLLRRNPDLVRLLASVMGTAPRIAEMLARRPQVLDALLDPAFFGPLPDRDTQEQRFAATLADAASDEDFLDRIRLLGQEQKILIAMRVLSGTLTATQAGAAYARLAVALVRFLHAHVLDRFVAQHGRVPGMATAVLALGKLGGREMTAGSDLDLIVLYEFDKEHPESDGPRPLYGAQYFARLTQRLINALTVQTNVGKLYDVDMRLRPSGRSGPLAASLDSFRSYQLTEAWTWEHMALTRARVISAPPDFAARVEESIREVLAQPRDPDAIAGDVVEMRRAIAEEKGEGEAWDLKHAAGGLVDLEFIAQYLQLVYGADQPELFDTNTGRVFDGALRLGLIPVEDAETLRGAVRLYQNLTQVLRLCLSAPFDPNTAGANLLALLTRAGDVPDFATLDAHLRETQAKVRTVFDRLLGNQPG
ncbi:bifunctional [glutamine synthetase] adenylyltransferase/[glutamine synthetase]-adenylyl-L-tyrosine phosphorylase [Blastochloris viridis]|uniref:Bifunctional glutamine synthetase adenylyltransferase/adenylyl-removing enzyme n=1 Tax=Blastochloris viridis TaxID=1079 RepID=A0A0H5BHW3_BLAVI|nr:bifunctional [glutamine synthetase] adenylyltransferase/[glutamine synthetase]-adenylyl-L-tyrosine phosphorylase [Blastochloris viridis]ALK10097.1 Glutamate-ammonia-ligase adenylyltransferase [Blastochloris viridis]BAR99976.1 glutamate-ammonia-ligase adenylyltransferase [Blastochloris viridis]CUU42761.1 Glutamate-ammonia-ligase adenylyltransferase [Blastochloris viridis]